MGWTYKCGRNVLKSHLRNFNGIIKNMKLSFWRFSNFHQNLRQKMSGKYPILQLWPLGGVFPLYSTVTKVILPDAEFHKQSFDISQNVARRCPILVLAEKRLKSRFYSRIFKNIRKNSSLFWTIWWVLQLGSTEKMISTYPRDLTKFTEFSLFITLLNPLCSIGPDRFHSHF